MLNIFSKLWHFAEDEQGNIKKSVSLNLLAAFCHSLQFLAIYIGLKAIFIRGLNLKIIGICSLILLLSLLGQIICKRTSMYQQTHVAYFTAANHRLTLGEKLKTVPMGFFNDMTLGHLISIATNHYDNLETWVPTLYIQVLGGFLNTTLFIFSLYTVNVQVALVATIGALIFVWLSHRLNVRSREAASALHHSKNQLTGEVLASIEGMQVIKAYQLRGENNQRLDQAITNTQKTSCRLEHESLPYLFLGKMLIALTSCLMAYFALRSYQGNTLALPETILILVASFMIFDGLLASGSAMSMIHIVDLAIEAGYSVQQLPDMAEGQKQKANRYDFSVRQVSFAYQERPVLKEISCDIPAQAMTAIVGPSGSGKTTLCHLLARFWDVDAGHIYLGDTDLRDFQLAKLQEQIAMVFQDVYLFNDTVENNIKFGQQSASHEAVVQAAKAACCHDFIMALPDGYDTVIGEGGGSLSGGEQQRLSIARAMLKDAPIIIFDEATANVDPENEELLRQAIEALTVNKTVIMIAHRLKTIRHADQILVLDQGRLVEQGQHEDLLKQGGLYYQLIQSKAQAENWKIRA